MAATIPGGAGRAPSSKRGLGRPATVLITLAVLLAAVMVLAMAGAVGYTLYLDQQYDKAAAELEHKDYAGAIGSLGGIPEFFRETPALRDYAKAGELLGKGDYDGARSQFERLKDFRDSQAMVTETDYRHARALLDSKDYQGAAGLLEGLAKQGYQDSADLLLEAQYTLAGQKLEAEEFEQAAELLQRLAAKKYKDAEALLPQANYRWAVALYRAGEYAQAQTLFAGLDDFEKSDTYYLLTQLQLKQYKANGYNSQKAAFKKLLALGDEEDYVQLLTGDDWICILLEGRWMNGENDFVLKRSEDSWSISYTLPYVSGEFFKIEDSIVYLGSDQAGWNKCFQLTFSSDRIMMVRCFKDGSEYKLYRSVK